MAKILIVEDYPNIRKIFQTALAGEGYDVTVASDGQDALDILKELKPDLILLDLLMANIGGLEFLRTFDAKNHPETKVVVFSNLSSPELYKEAMELGAENYLAKSKFTPKELVAEIKDILSKKSKK